VTAQIHIFLRIFRHKPPKDVFRVLIWINLCGQEGQYNKINIYHHILEKYPIFLKDNEIIITFD